MQITVNIPDETAERMLGDAKDAARELLELAVPSALREGRIFESEAAALLGMSSRFELWEWLKTVDPSGGGETADSVEADLGAIDADRKLRERQ